MPELIAIDDPADPRINAYRNIRERDLVGRQRLFVAEGTIVLEKLVGSNTHTAVSLLIVEKRLASLEPLWSRLPEGVPVFVATQTVVNAIAGFALHRGVLAIGRRSDDRTADMLLAEIGQHEARANVLLLCGIANHDNMGGIFRNAAAFGVRAILLDPECCDPMYRKAIRVSVGAALIVPFARLLRGDDALALLDRHSFAPVGRDAAVRVASRPAECSAARRRGAGAGPGFAGPDVDPDNPDGGRVRLAQRRDHVRHRAASYGRSPVMHDHHLPDCGATI